MKTFYISIAIILIGSVLFGVILPYLVSAKSTIAVIIALAIVLLLIIAIGHFIVSKLKGNQNESAQ